MRSDVHRRRHFAGCHRTGQAIVGEQQSSNRTENGSEALTRLATWPPISSVLNALTGAGIEILRMNEFPYSPYNDFSDLEERGPGRFYLQHRGHDVPFVYSILAQKIRQTPPHE